MSAAGIKVLTTSNMMGVLHPLEAAFTEQCAYALAIDHGGAAPVKARVASGEAVDVVIHSRWALDELAAGGKVRHVVDIARIPVALAVRAGAAKPAIGSADALRHVLLAAASMATPDPAGGSLGGIYCAELLQRLGIADQLQARLKLTGGATAAAELVAKGGAQMAIDQRVQLNAVPGLAIIKLPAELKPEIVMAAAVATTAQDETAATALIAFLSSPAAASAIRAKGMEP